MIQSIYDCVWAFQVIPDGKNPDGFPSHEEHALRRSAGVWAAIFAVIVLIYLVVAMCLTNHTLKKYAESSHLTADFRKVKVFFAVFIFFISLITLAHLGMGWYDIVICSKFTRQWLGIILTVLADFFIALPILVVHYFEHKKYQAEIERRKALISEDEKIEKTNRKSTRKSLKGDQKR